MLNVVFICFCVVFVYSCDNYHHTHNSGHCRSSAVSPAASCSTWADSWLPVSTIPGYISAARIWNPSLAPGLRSSTHAHSALPGTTIRSRTTSNISGSQWVIFFLYIYKYILYIIKDSKKAVALKHMFGQRTWRSFFSIYIIPKKQCFSVLWICAYVFINTAYSQIHPLT